MDGDALAETTSLCPDCLRQVPGRYEERDDGVYLARDCEDHGETSRRIWGSLDHWEWADDFGPSPEYDGGDLTVDGDHACLAVVEVTDDCNLSCSYCFASAGPGGDHRPTAEITAMLDTVGEAGGRPIQFSGGEPTVRDDLPALVAQARERGIDHVEVNTNGIRLATEDGYAAELAEAGVTAVYLQFDGLRRETYETIREVDLLAEKHAAIEACRGADLPVVLVPTVVPDVNDDEMGDIVRFAVENRDIVRSVNFQPVAHFGRYATDDGRFALDVAARRLADQLDALDPRDLLPAPCCSSYCQIGTAVLERDGEPVPITGFVDDDLWAALAGAVDERDYMDLLAGTAAGQERVCSAAGCCDAMPAEVGDLFADAVPVSITGFMDADAADVNRLSNCCLSVPTPDGDLVPFCGYNMTTSDGAYALRNRNEWGGRPSVDGQRADGDTPDSGRPSVDEQRVDGDTPDDGCSAGDCGCGSPGSGGEQ